jgi:hypothetical protein
MALVTGTPLGNLQAQEDLYFEGAPHIYFQDYTADPLKNPDGDGYYWDLSGTTAYPVYNVGCPTDVSLTENLTINDILCDHIGTIDTVQQRNYIEFTFTIQSFFPLSVLRHMLKGGSVVTETPPTAKFGLGKVNNNQQWMVYAPKVYDEDVGDYVMFHLHKAKFVDAFTLNMNFGTPWQMTGIKLRAGADTTKPAGQQFGVFMRADASVIV